jgi:hypothetical protein
MTSEIIYLSLDAINFNCYHLFTLIFNPNHQLSAAPLVFVRCSHLLSLAALFQVQCSHSSLFATLFCHFSLPSSVVVRCPLLSSLTPSSALHSRCPSLAFVILRCPLLSLFAALVFDEICMLARQQRG